MFFSGSGVVLGDYNMVLGGFMRLLRWFLVAPL